MNHGEHRAHGDLVLKELSEGILGCAIEVHKRLGPGLLESAYETCLAYELEHAGFRIDRQKPMPLHYRELALDCGYRLDLLVNDSVIIEIKAVDTLLPIHDAQLIDIHEACQLQAGIINQLQRKITETRATQICSLEVFSVFSVCSVVKDL